MTAFDIPDLKFVDLTLEPEQRQVKGIGPGVQEPSLGKRLTAGLPVAVQIKSGDAEGCPDLARFIENEAKTHRYYVVHLAATFNPDPSEPFEKAWVQIELCRIDGTQSPVPIAFYMEPLQESDPVELTDSAQLTSDLLKVVTGQLSSEKKRTGKEVYVQALYEQQPNPAWEFTSTQTSPLKGMQRLRLVARCPSEAKVRGTVTLTALVRKRHLSVIPYKAQFPGDAVPDFDLS